jgi:hypothetical protein
LFSAGDKGTASFAGGAVGRTLTKGAEVIFNRIKKPLDKVKASITAEGTAVLNFLENEVQRLKLTFDAPLLTPAERTRSALVDTIDNVAKNSFSGADTYFEYTNKRGEILDTIATSIKNSFGGEKADPKVIGDVFDLWARDSKVFFEAGAKHLRNNVEDYVANINPIFGRTGVVREKAKQTLKIIENTGGLASKAQGGPVAKGLEKATRPKGKITDTGLLDAQGNPIHKLKLEDNPHEVLGGLHVLMTQLANATPTKPVAELIQTRSALFAYQKQIGKTFELQGSPLAKNINDSIGHLNNSIEDALKQTGVPPVIREMWKDQNAIFSESGEIFKDKIAKEIFTMARDSPAGFAKGLVKARDAGVGGLAMVRKAKEMLLPTNIDLSTTINLSSRQKTWRNIQSEVLHGVFKNSRDRNVGNISGDAMLDNLDKWDRPILNELFGKEHTDRLYRFAETMSLVQRKNPVSTGGLAIQFTQFGAILAILRGKLGIEAGVVVIAPGKMAKLMTTKRGIEIMEQGAKMSKLDPRWPALAGRLLTTMTTVALEDKQFMDKPQRTTSKTGFSVDDLLGGPQIVK